MSSVFGSTVVNTFCELVMTLLWVLDNLIVSLCKIFIDVSFLFLFFVLFKHSVFHLSLEPSVVSRVDSSTDIDLTTLASYVFILQFLDPWCSPIVT